MALPHELNPTGRFSDRSDDYVKYRPSYPAEAIDAMIAGLESSERVAADVGAGTGISARLLGDRGWSVLAVEPNQAMRDAAEPHARVVFRAGTAEKTGLDDSSVNLVLAAQAFHWFRPEESIAEFARILRPGGRLALVWNRRRDDDPFTFAYRTALLEVARDGIVERMDFDSAVVEKAGLFSTARLVSFPYDQKLDLEALLGRARSASYVPKSGRDAVKVTEKLRSLFAEHADSEGQVQLRYVTQVHLADVKKAR
jgi:SAM-dependent methyltransferase